MTAMNDAAGGPETADLDASPDDALDVAAWGAVGELSHRYLTGLILALVVRHGTARASEIVFRTFRRQHLELFLPGLAKLGLDHLPPAVACAQYHVLSNSVGGVRVEWIPESDTKSWVRYLPPRWIFDGTAVCGVPTEVSRAMLRGWHGHNGVSLGNDRLGFVATMQTTDGQPGLEGYYVEEDHPLDVDDRVRFRPGERPAGQPSPLRAPAWSAEHLAKVERNYAVAYLRTMLPELCAVLGPVDGVAVGRTAGLQIGMQYHSEVMHRLNTGEPATAAGGNGGNGGNGATSGSEAFARRLARLLNGHGSRLDAEADGDRVVVRRNEVFTDDSRSDVIDAWTGLWEGLAAMENLRLVATGRADRGDPVTTIDVRPR